MNGPGGYVGSSTSEHNSLTGLQGGTPDEYYHLDSAQYSKIESFDFVDLNDTPSAYTGQAGKVPMVNIGESGLEFSEVLTSEFATNADNAVNAENAASVVIANYLCDSTVFVGAWVYFDYTTASFKNAIANDSEKVNVFGVCKSKVDSTHANILFGGITPEIYTGLTVGRKFLSDTVEGEMRNDSEVASGNYTMELGTAFTDKTIAIKLGTPLKRL